MTELHAALGRWLLQHGPGGPDPFSITPAPGPLSTSSAYDVLVAMLASVDGSLTIVAGLHVLVAAGAGSLLGASFRRVSVAAALAVASALLLPRWLHGPELFALLLVAAAVFVALRRSRPLAWALPLLALLGLDGVTRPFRVTPTYYDALPKAARSAARPSFRGVAAFLGDQLREPRVFTDPELADAIVYRVPGARVYVDSRASLRRYQDVLAHPWLVDTEAARHRLQTIIVRAGEPAFRSLAQHLAASPRWNLAYLDGEAAVFLEKGVAAGEPVDLAARVRDAVRGGASLAALTRSLVALGRVDLAKETVEPSTQCLVRFTDFDRRMSAQAVDAGSEQELTEVRSLCASDGLALGLLEMGVENWQEAAQRFGEAAAKDPSDFHAHYLLGRALVAANGEADLPRIEVELQEAARLRPYDPRPFEELGGWLSSLGKTKHAQPYLTAARLRRQRQARWRTES